MKLTSLATLLAISATLSLSACSKKSDDVTPASTTPTTTAAAGFQVKINGTLFAPDMDYALATFPGGDGYYAIYGLDSKTSNVVLLALPNTVGEGTAPLNSTNVGGLTINQQEYTTANGGSGTVTITKKTATNLMGTFSFTAYDASGANKTTLTEGSFNVAFK